MNNLNQTDGQTDGQTRCDRKTVLCTIVHCAVNKSYTCTRQNSLDWIWFSTLVLKGCFIRQLDISYTSLKADLAILADGKQTNL